MSNFNFLTDAEQTKTEPHYVGPNLKTAAKMTPRKFAQTVLEVFDQLGGASWLITEARADSKAFLTLLQKLIPKSVQLDDLTGLQVTLIDQFNNRIEIANPGAPATPADKAKRADEAKGACQASDNLKSGQLQIATGGSPDSVSPLNQEGVPSPDINITEVFK